MNSPKDFEDVASGGGTARCSMQSNNEVFKKASCESREVSSVHGESHVPKRGSPGKWDPTMLNRLFVWAHDYAPYDNDIPQW
jgi:hypothetical protein